MLNPPPLDVAREAGLERAVREAVAGPIVFLEDGPDLSNAVLGELWTFQSDAGDGSNPKALCTVMALAIDAIRGARRALLVHDLGAVFTLLRRADEMQTLAAAFGLIDGEARRWLEGGPVRQRDLRRGIERANPKLAELARTTFEMLSDEAHGRAQNLAVYENADGEFSWPPVGGSVDPRRIRAACALVLGVLLAHFGVLKWFLRDWNQLSPELASRAAAYYDALQGFVVAHQEHGNWHAIAPGHAAEWLGITSAAAHSRADKTVG